MSVNLLAPDLRRAINDLANRIGVLERRLTSRVAAAATTASHTHDGEGTHSTVVTSSSETPDAPGDRSFAGGPGAGSGGASSVAVGDHPIVIGDNSIGIGTNADISSDNGIGIGEDTDIDATDGIGVGTGAIVIAGCDGGVALGAGTVVNNLHSVALGDNSVTTGEDQVNMGAKSLYAGAGVGGSGSLIANQFTVYLDEGANQLHFLVKYSNGTTVKNGSVTLT